MPPAIALPNPRVRRHDKHKRRHKRRREEHRRLPQHRQRRERKRQKRQQSRRKRDGQVLHDRAARARRAKKPVERIVRDKSEDGRPQEHRRHVERLREQEQNWMQKKQNVEEDARKDCKESVGFLEELEAMWTIITTRKLAGLFYGVFFILLMSLELFVVVSKFVDKECDYDAAIKGAQRVREAQFKNAYSRVVIQ